MPDERDRRGVDSRQHQQVIERQHLARLTARLPCGTRLPTERRHGDSDQDAGATGGGGAGTGAGGAKESAMRSARGWST